MAASSSSPYTDIVSNFNSMKTDTFSACWVILTWSTRSLTCVICDLFACVHTPLSLYRAPQRDRPRSISSDCKITDHSILVWINQFYCTVFLLRFHSRSNCINMVQSFCSCPVMIKSNKEIEVAQKTKPLAIK